MEHLSEHDLAVIDYGMGNLRSVLQAWERVGARPRLVDHPEQIGEAAALVFPGQGAIVDTMRLLQATGFDRAIRAWIAADRPFFGICLGLQALFEHSEEGNTPCLGIFPGEVRRFRFPPASGLKVPHMGWNNVQFAGGEGPGEQYYFVHSYYVTPTDPSMVWGTTEYGGLRFCSAIARGNCYATQFHPEKSQKTGLALYAAFLATLGVARKSAEVQATD